MPTNTTMHIQTIHSLALALLALGATGREAFTTAMAIRYGKDRRFLKLPTLP